MAALRIALMALGVLAILCGGLWMGQGTGIIRWPASSFMIDMSEWTVRGAIVLAAGLLVVILARRVGR